MSTKLTNSTQQLLNAIITWFKQYHYPPTIRELATKLKFSSTCPVRYHLNKLEELGYIKLNRGMARGITLLSKLVGIPIVGRVSAGRPIDAVENIEGYIEIQDMFKNHENIFGLRIKGDSMKDAGIFDGDIAFVRKQSSASNGDIVVALTSSSDEAVVKKFYLTKHGVKLVSANPNYKPIISKDVEIIGKVVAVLRKYY